MNKTNIRTVTKISTTKAGRMALFFDEEFDFSVDMETFVKQNIKVGEQYAPEEYEELLEQSQYVSARQKAFNLLSYKSYTRKMLEERLLKDYTAESVSLVLKRIQELGLLNDSEYALRQARDFVNIKKYAPTRVRLELRQRGIEEEDIQLALEQFDEDDQDQRMAQLILRKYSKNLQEEKGKRKAVNALVRLGYGYGEINRVIENLSEDSEYYNQDE